jgi:hypothetical protein
MRLPLGRLAIVGVDSRYEIVTFDSSRTVVVAAMCRHVIVILVNAVHVLDIGAVKETVFRMDSGGGGSLRSFHISESGLWKK